MNVSCFTVNPFAENVYVVWNETSHSAFVIDPGMMLDSERSQILDFIKGHHLSVKMILLTHAHVDHAASADWLAEKTESPIFLNDQDAFLASHLQEQATMFGLGIKPVPLSAHEAVVDGQTLDFGEEPISVIATPGHTPGSVSYYMQKSGILFSGDTIFQNGVGRTDLPGGSYNALIDSVRNRILKLPPQTTICPGHGAATTVGAESTGNPYC